MWRYAAARAAGPSHLASDLPCQDRFACAVPRRGILVAVLADGAGSAAMAERGAEIAVTAMADQVQRLLWGSRPDHCALLRRAAARARDAVAAEAGRRGHGLEAYASTLLAVVLTPEGGGALQVGDGVIVIGAGGQDWRWVFWPQRGEYANTTHFLTDDGAVDRLSTATLDGTVTDLALMSDGLESLALHYASRTVHGPFFDGMFRPLVAADGGPEIGGLSASLESFLASDRVASRTDDDVSVILATRRKSGPVG